MENILQIFGPQVKQKGIVLRVFLQGNELYEERCDELVAMPILLGDERRFKQVLINLIRNAIKFTKMGSIKISVEYKKSSSSNLSVKVEDTGVGIEEKDLQRLFTRFGKL